MWKKSALKRQTKQTWNSISLEDSGLSNVGRPLWAPVGFGADLSRHRRHLLLQLLQARPDPSAIRPDTGLLHQCRVFGFTLAGGDRTRSTFAVANTCRMGFFPDRTWDLSTSSPWCFKIKKKHPILPLETLVAGNPPNRFLSFFQVGLLAAKNAEFFHPLQSKFYKHYIAKHTWPANFAWYPRSKISQRTQLDSFCRATIW